MKKLKFIAFSLAVATGAAAGDFTTYVDPFIGTGAAEGGLSGNTYPGATVPFGMVQLSPDTHTAPDWFNASGYSYNDNRIYGFTHTHLSGTGACDLIDISLFPTTGESVSSAFSHDEESASPGYYKVRLSDEDIIVELSATTRVGIHRYTFPENSVPRIIVDLEHSAQKGSWDRRIINSQIKVIDSSHLEGYRVITGWAKLRKVYFVAEFSEPFDSIELYDGKEKRRASVINGRELHGRLSFRTSARQITVKVALSGVSADNARENLVAEASDWVFDNYAAAADSLWNCELGKIEVEGSTENKKTFYTALYHTLIQPNTFSDVNGEYMSSAYSVRRLPEGKTQYTTFSLWDTYRAAHPLYTLLQPDRDADFVNSMLRHYEDYGYLPVWHLWGQENYCMIGNHAIPVVVDAVLKRLPGIEAGKAFEAVKQSSLQSHLNFPSDIWEQYGYMPEPLQSQSVSLTLEAAYNDWCVARLAEYLGDEEDRVRFDRRAAFYANLYNAETGFFRAKDEKGKWLEPFDPLKYGANGGYPYTESNAWQYLWYVPHDIHGFIALCGGKKAFEKKLDTFFTLNETSGKKNDNISGLIGQYAHGNEPSHHVAYLYNDAGASHKCQEVVHYIMKNLYGNSCAGYMGNDDCGEMSAWFVFSAMGFYPVNPAAGEYYLGTPLFDKCILNLPNGKKFVINAERRSPDRYLVENVKLNKKNLTTMRISHTDITAGGILDFIIR